MPFNYATLTAKLDARGYLSGDELVTAEITDNTVFYSIALDRVVFTEAFVPSGTPYYNLLIGVYQWSDETDRNTILETALENVVADLRSLRYLPDVAQTGIRTIGIEDAEYKVYAITIRFREPGRII